MRRVVNKRIINEILLLSEIQQKRVEPTPIDMVNLIERILKSLALTFEHYQGEISLPQTWHTALGHAPWIEEVWTNYITNALKYGGDPPRLQLGSTLLADNMVGFWVRDNGDQFTQLVTLNFNGHGLGLWIVKRIIKKLGGDTWVESKGIPGRDSVFYFSLPGTIND